MRYLPDAPQAEPQAAGFSSGAPAAPQAAGAVPGSPDAPQAEPQAAGFSSGEPAAPQAAGVSAGLSEAPQAEAARFSAHPASWESAMVMPSFSDSGSGSLSVSTMVQTFPRRASTHFFPGIRTFW